MNMPALDAVTIVIKECVSLSTAMRKYSKLATQSGVVALLGGNGEMFNDELGHRKLSSSRQNDPYLSGFVQLRLMLNKLNNLDEVDSLTIFQPFLIILTASSVSGYITSMALDSLQKFFTLKIINERSKNYRVAIRELVDALTHCKFESSSQISDDAVLMKVLFLTNCIIDSHHGDCITDSLMYEVFQTILALACNNRRNEVLRKAAESNIIAITVKVFSKVRNIQQPEIGGKYVNDESYTKNILNGEAFGANIPLSDDASMMSSAESVAVDNIDSKLDQAYTTDRKEGVVVDEQDAATSNTGDSNNNVTVGEQRNTDHDDNVENESIDTTEGDEPALENNKDAADISKKEKIEETSYGLPVAGQYLNLLLSLILPEQKVRHTTTTRILALKLINVAVEIVGDKLTIHPRLFALVSDPIFKSVLFIIQGTDKLSLLQAALQLFTTFVVILGHKLQPQIEMTLKRIFAMLSDEESLNNKNPSKNTPKLDKSRSPPIRELLVEQISILWSRSPLYFTSIFIDFDCELDRSDLAIKFLTVLTKLSLPESAISTTPSVPPICLEGLISFVDDLYEQIKSLDRDKFLEESKNVPKLLQQRELKTEFIRCAEAFNKKPKNGIPLLVEKGFIKSENDRDIAEFLFENNSRFNKKTIGLYLCDPKKTELLQEFIDFFDFKGLRVDEAIRILLTKFRLPGESQQIERIVEAFSKKYVSDQNYNTALLDTEDEKELLESIQPDSDSVFILSYSIIMLNTDLHNPQVKEHMSFEDYSGNLKGCYNSNDFPFWYLDRIYCSIRDKEIVMPEEHHGNERWFEDAWNNLISSATVVTEAEENSSSVIDKLTLMELEKFNKAIYTEMGQQIIETFFRIFEIATDDHIATKMLGSVEKLAYISLFFEMKDTFNDIVHQIAQKTSLMELDEKFKKEDTMPLIEINIEGEKLSTIPVSSASIRLGSSLKAQLATVSFFRIIQKKKEASLLDNQIWSDIVEILTTLYENLLIPADIFPDLQKRLVLSNLPKRAPDVSINKTSETRGFLSTFASYLKGDEEPTEDEVEAANVAQNCIKSCNIPSSLFGNEANITPELIKKLLESVPTTKTQENSSYFESEILFFSELVVGLFLFCKDQKTGHFVIEKLFEFGGIKDLSKRCSRRLMTYKTLMLSILEVEPDFLLRIIQDDFLAKPEIFGEKYFNSKHGSALLKNVLVLSEIEHYRKFICNEETFWTFLRKICVVKEHVQEIYLYTENLLKNNRDVITEKNFTWVLGLLDEISSFGSLASKWESEYSTLVASGHKVEKDNPFQDLVEVSLKSINLTAHLLDKSQFPDIYSTNIVMAIVQALAHQCTNPCEQLRSYAISSLQDSLTDRVTIPSQEIQSLEQLFEDGLIPILMADEQTNVEEIKAVFPMISKLYIHYLKQGITTNETYLRVLNIFNRYVENSEVENQLQQLIIEKKEVEAGNA
ncbi:Arf family guanine nucleotide exchange factor GEA2 [Nakaseomyces bracarensis]|uniref:Arf family guanine nucleotide exchange factor GEA2 n=1 Tax=Nakaseomyces bracarensis TaxID=273131 RepID=UPI003871A9AE